MSKYKKLIIYTVSHSLPKMHFLHSIRNTPHQHLMDLINGQKFPSKNLYRNNHHDLNIAIILEG